MTAALAEPLVAAAEGGEAAGAEGAAAEEGKPKATGGFGSSGAPKATPDDSIQAGTSLNLDQFAPNPAIAH